MQGLQFCEYGLAAVWLLHVCACKQLMCKIIFLALSYVISCLCTVIITDITENTVRPLLLSAVSPPTDNFTASVDVAMSDIKAALNGYNVNLKQTLYNYVRAVAAHHLDKVLSSVDLGFGIKANIILAKEQKQCAIQFGFNHVYNNTDAAAELVSLLQNISTAIGVIKQVLIQPCLHTNEPACILYTLV